MVYYLIYVSTARRLMLTEQLHDLLTSCRAANTAADITGALLYRDGTFMQALEGPQAAVDDVYARICRDPRHGDVTLITTGETAERQFADWSMAFRNLSADESDMAEGFSHLMQSRGGQPYGPSPTVAQRVLMSFRNSISRVT